MQAVQNLGLAVIAMVAGMIVDEKGYLWLEVFFCACLCVALLCTLLLLVDDLANNGPLNLTSKERRKREAAAGEREAERRRRGGATASRKNLTVLPHPTASFSPPTEEAAALPQVTEPAEERFSRLQPRSRFQLQNRLMSKLGVPMPPAMKDVAMVSRRWREVAAMVAAGRCVTSHNHIFSPTETLCIRSAAVGKEMLSLIQ